MEVLNMATKHDEWMAKNTMWVSIRIQNSSGIPESLQIALEKSGRTRNGFIIDAIREKLIREGYMEEVQSK